MSVSSQTTSIVKIKRLKNYYIKCTDDADEEASANSFSHIPIVHLRNVKRKLNECDCDDETGKYTLFFLLGKLIYIH